MPVESPLPLTLAQRVSPIRVLVLDVDGVLTRGGIVHGSTGLEIKEFHVRDGSGLVLWRAAGRHSALITGRSSPLVEFRAREVKIDQVFQGVSDKLAVLRGLRESGGHALEQICYVADDWPDLPVLEEVGLAVAVADACPEARARAHYITQRPGGGGAVREVIELILPCQGAWPL